MWRHQDGSDLVCGLSVRTEAWCLGSWDQEAKGKGRSKGERSKEDDKGPCRREAAAALLWRPCQGNEPGKEGLNTK